MLIFTNMAVGLILNVVFGAICAVVASGRGRSAVGWFFIGFFFGCLGLIILLVIPDLRIEEQRRGRLNRENRRLREQLRKDRMVADARHDDASRRLQAHDRALGVDTAPARPDLIGGEQEVAGQIQVGQPAASAGVGPPFVHSASPGGGLDHRASQWYFADAEGRQGPVSFTVLRSVWAQGAINAETYVWAEGMTDWLAIASVDGLAESLNG